MSNSIDFYQGQITELAIPAGRLCVFIGGTLSEHFEVVEVVRGSDGEYSRAKLRFSTDGYRIGSAGELCKLPAMGRTVDIVQLYDSGEGTTNLVREFVFSGQIESIDAVLGGGADVVEVIAKDMSARLDRITVSGRRFDTGEWGTRFDGTQLVFNEDNKGNASRGEVTRNGTKSNVFALGESAAYWSCGAACMYLLCEYLPFGVLSIPPVEYIDAVMGEVVCLELDVEGDSLLCALEKICQQVGVSFKFVPCGHISGQRIVFYRAGESASIELDIQHGGETLNLSRSQLGLVKRISKFWPVTHRYLAQGEKKIFEATFELVKAWDVSLEGKTVEEYSTGHEGFAGVCDVYRKWCLNEAGDYCDEPFNQGEMFDLSGLFDGAGFLPNRRTFLDAVSLDDSGVSYGVYTEVSCDDGVSWIEFGGSFDNLDDQCGVWVSDDVLGNDYFAAAGAGTLKFRVTASVEGDERLMCSVADGPVDSVVEVIDHIVKPDGTYEYRRVSGKSVFYRDGAGVDDSEKLFSALRRAANRVVNVIEIVEAQTPFVRTNIYSGSKVVSGADGRDVLGGRSDGRSVFWVDRVVMDFVNQTTRLKILRKRQFDV